MSTVALGWRCPACAGTRNRPGYRVAGHGTENGVDASIFRPSADRFGETVSAVVRCLDCGHGSLVSTPSSAEIAAAYAQAADPVSLDEEEGQIETGRRALAWAETQTAPGVLVDFGCWTGSFLVAAAERGWTPIGIEPSAWAAQRARDRGLDVREIELAAHELAPASARCVALCDVLEHLLEPLAALRVIHDLLEPGGVLYLTVPDAGSLLARAMGRRWWSVLPMHVQYFTRRSMRRLLTHAGLEVVAVRSHPKVFTAGYYVDRLGGYSAAVARVGRVIAGRLGIIDRLVAPDFHDRMQVLARRPGNPA